jgi:hypothetical protein
MAANVAHALKWFVVGMVDSFMVMLLLMSANITSFMSSEASLFFRPWQARLATDDFVVTLGETWVD